MSKLSRYIIVRVPVSISQVEDAEFDLRVMVERECIAHAEAAYAGTPYADSTMKIKSIEGPLVPFPDEYSPAKDTFRLFIGRVGPAELNPDNEITLVPIHPN